MVNYHLDHLLRPSKVVLVKLLVIVNVALFGISNGKGLPFCGHRAGIPLAQQVNLNDVKALAFPLSQVVLLVTEFGVRQGTPRRIGQVEEGAPVFF